MSEITEDEGMALYDEALDDAYDEVSIGYGTYSPSKVLKECDPIAYRTGFSDYADFLASEGTPVEGWYS
jgi:hypothetical protein